MNLEKFTELSTEYSLIPVYEKAETGGLSPISVFSKLREGKKYCFLFESVDEAGPMARFSFIGYDPEKIISNRGGKVIVNDKNEVEESETNIFDLLQVELNSSSSPCLEDLPSFSGGIIGYLGFENISLLEPTIKFSYEDKANLPDSIWGIFHNIIAFDHLKKEIIIIKNIIPEGNKENLTALFNNAKKEISELKDLLQGCIESKSGVFSGRIENPHDDSENFISLVEKAKENILCGDIFQIVLSKRFYAEYKGDLFNIYKSLREINPSPYMYYMTFQDDLTIIGTSPEDLLKVMQRNAAILPIAGTRKRGNGNEEDKTLALDLRGDPKENAEHTMLVDLARNDLGRVCEYGSIKQTCDREVRNFSHVMHMVSKVEGKLQKDKSCIDALKASFPAGTVTGAPKIRSVQLINEYEKTKRNIYAGAIGYIGFNGNLDMCIAIRTLWADKNKIYWQAGAGIVADSKPELELSEIINKSAVIRTAIKLAETI